MLSNVFLFLKTRLKKFADKSLRKSCINQSSNYERKEIEFFRLLFFYETY